MDVKEIDILGNKIQTHWYYASKAKALLRICKERNFDTVFDIGAGSGFFSKYLLQHTRAHLAVCIDTAYTTSYEENFEGKTINFCPSYEEYHALYKRERERERERERKNGSSIFLWMFLNM